jgi:large subunit ribosomal protein L25
MDTTLEVTPRDSRGKGVARKGRANGTIPAVVYGPTEAPKAISVDPAKLKELFKQTGNRNTLVQVKIGDAAPLPCLVREVQKHPATREILHVDFYAVPREGELTVLVPVNPVGRPKGALIGGRIRLVRRALKVSCPPDRIPAKLDIDVTELDVDQYLKASQVPLPEGVKVVWKQDFNIVGIVGKAKKEEEAPKPAAAAEGATPAEPAAEKKD